MVVAVCQVHINVRIRSGAVGGWASGRLPYGDVMMGVTTRRSYRLRRVDGLLMRTD